MRKPDAIYNDILPEHVSQYVGFDDEECHVLESTRGIKGELRYNIKIWLWEEK